jgi:hypothetical protein
MSLLSSTLPALQQSYTPPTLPSFSAAKAQAKTSVSNFLTGAGVPSDGAAATAFPGATQAGATGSVPPTKFHQLLDQAMKKSAQGMARHTASAVGVHPDQSSSPTNGQMATGHAVSVIA